MKAESGSRPDRALTGIPIQWLACMLSTCVLFAPKGAGEAQAEDVTYGFYELGVGLIEEASLVDFASEPLSDNAVRFNPGFRFGVGFGGDMAPWLRVEFQSGFHYNSIESIQGAEASSGNLYQVPLQGNIVFRLPNKTGLIPYAGAGFGAICEVLDSQNLQIGNTTVTGTEATWAFGYQGLAGLNYFFREDLALGVSYHYTVADGPSWSLDGGGNIKLDAIRTHSLAIMLSYRF